MKLYVYIQVYEASRMLNENPNIPQIYLRACEHDMWAWALVLYEMVNGMDWAANGGHSASKLYVLLLYIGN